MSDAVTSVTGETFEQVVIQSENLVMVDFWATWCGPCKIVAPVVEELAKEYESKVVFAKVNTEEQQELAGAFGIQSIPTLAIFREKIMIYKQPGALLEAALEDIISQVQKLDMEKIIKQRTHWPFFRDRRVDTYHFINKKWID